jgi:Lon protease-like protein
LFLGEEDEDIDERLTASLMDYVESPDQHKDVMIEISNEAREPYVFSENLCMIAGFAKMKWIVI